MTSLLNILDAVITVLISAVVWTLLGVGLFQLIPESIRTSEGHRNVARNTRSWQETQC